MEVHAHTHTPRGKEEREILPEYRKAICFLLNARTLIAKEDSTNLNIYKMPETNVPLLTKEPAILNLAKGLAAQIHTRNEVLDYS